MLHLLPIELTLNVLSHLPISSLLSLPVLSRQWFDFFATNQSRIFHRAAIAQEYIKPETVLLEDALSMNRGRPWAGSTSWKDFCCRSFQLCKNWEGKGRGVARVLMPSGTNAHHIEVDEKAGICITTRRLGGMTVNHLFSGTSLWCLPKSHVYNGCHCEYDNGYVVFSNRDGDMEVWRLASDFSTEDEVAAEAPPNDVQMTVSAHAAEVYRQYAPRGHFRPWALLTVFLPQHMRTYRLVYPTLICASLEQIVLYDVRTGSLVQVVNIDLQTLSYVDVSEHHVFVCEQDVVHVFSRGCGIEVLRIPADATVRCSQRVEDPLFVSGDRFITPISVSPEVDESPCPKFIAARVSRDGRDLVILSEKHRVIFIRDFERICRGETTFERAAVVLGIRPEDICYDLGFEHGRVCVAAVHGLYIFTFGPDLSANAVFVRPSHDPSAKSSLTGCMQLTDRHIYFTWEDLSHRQDIPLFEDAENALELPSPPIFIGDRLEFEEPAIIGQWMGQHTWIDSSSVGCIDFTLMPEDYVSES